MSVRRVPCSVEGVRSAITKDHQVSLLTLHQDVEPIPTDVLTIVRTQPSPLVLFENPSIDYDPSFFDLIIPALIRPEAWLEYIATTIAQSQQLHAYSRELREDSAAVRSDSRKLRARSHTLLPNPVDLNTIWRTGCASGRPLSLPPGFDDPDKKP